MRKANSKAYAGEAAQKDGVSRRILMAWLPRLRSGQVQPRPTNILEFERVARPQRFRAGLIYAAPTALRMGRQFAARCARWASLCTDYRPDSRNHVCGEMRAPR
jgi:hypothetical protein